MADPPKKPLEGRPPVPIFRQTGRPYAPPSQVPTSLGRTPHDEVPDRTGELMMKGGAIIDTMAPPSSDQVTRQDLQAVTVKDFVAGEQPPAAPPPPGPAPVDQQVLAAGNQKDQTVKQDPSAEDFDPKEKLPAAPQAPTAVQAPPVLLSRLPVLTDPAVRRSLLGEPVKIPRAVQAVVTPFSVRPSQPAIAVQEPPESSTPRTTGRTTVDDPDDLPVLNKSIGGLGRLTSWIPQRKSPPKSVNDNRTDEEVDADLKAKTARDHLRSRMWIAAGLLAFAGFVYWGLFTNPFGKKSTLPSTEAAVASTIKTPAPQPATPAPATAPVQQVPVAVATPPSVQPSATPPPVEQAPVPAPQARAIRSLEDKTPPKPTPPPVTTSVPKEKKVTVSSKPVKEQPKPAKAEVKAASKKVAVASASSILVVATLPMCEGMQVQCPEGKSGCMTRLQSAGHSEATARGACWRCTTACQTAFVLVDPTVTVPVDVPPSTTPEPLAPPPSTPTISCPEGRAACITRLTSLHGAATARGACWRCL